MGLALTGQIDYIKKYRFNIVSKHNAHVNLIKYFGKYETNVLTFPFYFTTISVMLFQYKINTKLIGDTFCPRFILILLFSIQLIKDHLLNPLYSSQTNN